MAPAGAFLYLDQRQLRARSNVQDFLDSSTMGYGEH